MAAKGPRPQPVRARCEKHIAYEPNTGCWLWIGATTGGGYGNVWVAGKWRPAHRVLFEIARGEVIPAGLQLDHLCRVRRCVNPDHLEIVTAKENIRRSPLIGQHHRRRTHCKRGHLIDGFRPQTQRRYCLACAKLTRAERSARAA